MPAVRAKFKVTEKTLTESGQKIKLSAVTSGSEENKEFFKWTPFGQIEIGIVNDETANSFECGKEYFIDFTPAN